MDYILIWSNIFYLLVAAVAFHRGFHIRAVGFLLVTFGSSYYHACFQEHLCAPDLIWWQLDYWYSLWMSLSVILLFGIWPQPRLYVLAETFNCTLSFCLIFLALNLYNKTQTLWLRLLFPGSWALVLIPCNWCWYRKIPRFSYLGLGLGFSLLVIALCFYFHLFHVLDPYLSHSLWHVASALGATTLFLARHP